MTQEEKQLLLKDLSARLPYKPMVHAEWDYEEPSGKVYHKEADRILEINDFYAIWDVRPYLRPMSSMTEEEEQYILHTWGEDHFNNGIDLMYDNYMMLGCAPDFVDWLNGHHFDYRGLIEKGLALEAPDGMYKTE